LNFSLRWPILKLRFDVVVISVEQGMGWKKLLEAASESINDHIRLRNDYLMAENRILRNQIEGRVQLTDSERKELAEIGAKLGKKALSEIATVAQPETILAWNRKFANQPTDTSKRPKSVGRPRVDKEIEDWVVRMACENRSWGYDRIQGSLKHLGYTVSDQTVGHILKRHGISPAPERKKTVTWREFIQSHWDVLVTTGFFGSEVWSGFRLAMSCLLNFIPLSCHQVLSLGMTLHQPGLLLKAITQFALNLSLDLYRCACPIREPSRTRPVFQLVLPPTPSEFEFADARQRQSPYKVKVISLSSARPKPIRDGPMQRHQRYERQCKDKQRKAA
jgi:transposase